MERSPEQPVYPLIPSLPDEVTTDIIARVPISHYPALSQVSKSFRNLIASSHLYERRSLLGLKEHRIYAVLRNGDDCRFYLLLHSKVKRRNRLVMVPSLPPMSSYGRYFPVGSKVYVFDYLEARSIDCTYHTEKRISDMPSLLSKVANVIEGKVYLIGGYLCCAEDGRRSWKKVVMVFDTETQLWEPMLVDEDMSVCPFWSDSVVMEGKIYIKGYSKRDSVVYEPKERKWELMDAVLNSKNWKGGCVVDDVLYYLDCSDKALRAYDLNQSRWSVVNGLQESLAVQTAQPKWCKAVKYGEKKLALFFSKNHDGNEVICCAEITLERREGGGIWGEMESCVVVIEDRMMSEMVKCVSVTV